MTTDADYIFIEATEPYFGRRVGMTLLQVHPEGGCTGPLHENGRPVCCIHNQTDHHMRTWPQVYRSDIRVMERECPHRIGHPDPDDAAFRAHVGRPFGAHSCDGCCQPPEGDQ